MLNLALDRSDLISLAQASAITLSRCVTSPCCATRLRMTAFRATLAESDAGAKRLPGNAATPDSSGDTRRGCLPVTSSNLRSSSDHHTGAGYREARDRDSD